MIQLNCTVKSRDEAAEWIRFWEDNFSQELDDALENVFAGEGAKIIALSGPTCSGKTTTAKKLIRRITSAGNIAVDISIDDFFFDRSDRNLVKDEAPDYDSVAAIDLDYLRHCIGKLERGERVLLPHYSFLDTARVGYHEYLPSERDIYVFEGIQAVYPEVTSMFSENYRSIFINVSEDVTFRGSILTRNEIRILRRLVRDYHFRNASPEFTFHLWETVRANEEANIFPNSGNCDVYINSMLPYEPFVIAPRARTLLEMVPADSRYRGQAEDLLRKLEAFDCPYFEETMIPANSVFREFIG